MNSPTIKTARLTLRELVPSDDEFVFRHFSDPDVCRFLFDAEPFVSIDEARELIATFAPSDGGHGNRWGLELETTGELIGTCGFHFWDRTNHIAELGYDLAKPHWGKGYMREALSAALGFGFQELQLNRIQAYTSVDNRQSVRLLERMGFTNEGVVRAKHFFRGRYYDHYCFSLLAGELN